MKGQLQTSLHPSLSPSFFYSSILCLCTLLTIRFLLEYYHDFDVSIVLMMC